MRVRNVSSVISVRAVQTMANGSGSVRAAYRLHSAGISLRYVRSPDAPKMISENGSSTDGMASERIPQRGQEPVGEGVVTPRAEAREEGGGDGRRGHRLVDGVLHRPAPLTRVLDVGFQRGELGVGGERVGGQLEQPGAHDAALVPQVGDARQVQA